MGMMACVLPSGGGSKSVSQFVGRRLRVWVCEVWRCEDGLGRRQAGKGAPRREGWGGLAREVRGCRGRPPRQSGSLCVRQAARPGSPGACQGMHRAGVRFCVPGGKGPRRAHAPLGPAEGASRWWGSPHSPPEVKGHRAVTARGGSAAGRAGRGAAWVLPAANASSGRPAHAGRPRPGHSPLASRRREVTLRAAYWAPPAPDAPSAGRLKGPAGREGEGQALGGGALGGAGNPQAPRRVFLHSLLFLFLSESPGFLCICNTDSSSCVD